jgi:putative ABC transport system permease protein
MPHLRDRLFRLATGRSTHEAELAEELALHLDLLTEELIEAGMEPAAARREAERRFGDRRRIGQAVQAIDAGTRRATRRRESMRRLTQDVRIAVRALLRQPGAALGGVLIVALGIGAATAMFTVLNAAFLRPFAYPDADRMVYVWEKSKSGNRMAVAGPNAVDWTAETRLFPTLAYFGQGQAILSDAGEPEYVRVAGVSRPFAAVLGLAPLLGRWFAEEEARVGGPPVVVVGEGLWRRRFGGDSTLVGRGIRLDGTLATVVGIMPRAFAFPSGTELWYPAEPFNDGTSRTAHNWRVIARLAPGVSPEVAQRDLSGLTLRLVENEKGADDFVAKGALVIPFRDQLIGDSRKVLLLLQGAVLLVLLIAAVNLTNLTLARAVRRQGDVGICLALGARRGDIVRRFATENLLITLTGGVAGLLLAGVLRGLLGRWIGRMLPFVNDLPLDRRVAGFAMGLAIVVGLVSSLVPAWRASGGLMGFTVSRGGTAGRSSRRLIDTLMGAEVALAVVLVSGAGLVGQSLLRLSGVDPGFAVTDRVVVQVPLRTGPGSPTPTRLAVTQAYDRLRAELRARPGTIAVAATSALPLWSGNPNGSAQVEGTPSAAGGPPAVSDFRIVSPDYFRALEIPVRKGREFQESDVAGSPYVAVVNQAFVEKYLDSGDPLGRRVRFPGMYGEGGEDPWATIVGVVGDTRQDALANEPEPAIYYTYLQRGSGWPITVVVHSTQPVAVVLADLKSRLAGLDRSIPFTGRPWTEVVRESLALPRIRSVLLALFAAIALLLAAAGIAAVVAFAVAQRTREIGLRIAVGASSGAITRNGVIRAARPVVLGLLVGVGGALLLGRLATSLLYGLSPSDPVTLSAAAGVTFAVALVAAYLPARKATRVDPLIAMRAE